MTRPLVIAAVAAILLTGCTATVPADPSGSAPAPGASAPVAGTVSCDYVAEAEAARQVDLPSAADVPASGTADFVMTLNGKPIALSLDRAKAPCTVHSFESLAAQGYFDGTACHRVTDSGIFVLQCGDPSGTGSGGPGYSIPDELEGIEGYPAGTLAMARTQAPHSGGSQFFIVYADSQLSPDYTVFGTIDAAAIETVAAIAAGGNDGSFGAAGGGKPLLPADIATVAAA